VGLVNVLFDWHAQGEAGMAPWYVGSHMSRQAQFPIAVSSIGMAKSRVSLI
jgi:hypothetical protein